MDTQTKAAILAKIENERAQERPLVEKMRECIRRGEQIMAEKCPVAWPMSIAWKANQRSRFNQAEDEAQRWADKANVHVARIRELNRQLYG